MAMTSIRLLLIAAGLFLAAASPSGASENLPVVLDSPDGAVRLDIDPGGGRLTFAIARAGRPVIAPSALGLVVDGVDLGRGATVGGVEKYRLDESYRTRGAHSRAISRCNGVRVSARHAESGVAYTVEARAFDDGVAFRIIVPGGDRPRVVDEATAFRLIPGSTVWYHDLRGHYEGVHAKKDAAELKAGEWVAPPPTIKLPDGRGYAAITEASLGVSPAWPSRPTAALASPHASGTNTRRRTHSR
jgi:alpha-glucosidase